MTEHDDYEHLGPLMRERLDAAESKMTRLGGWLDIMADRSPEDHIRAREIALLLSLPAPVRMAP